MAWSTDIRLSRDVEAMFPDRCCGCMRDRPGQKYHVSSRRAALVDLLFAFASLLRRPVRCAVPICGDCLRRATARRWRSRALLVVFLAIAVSVWASIDASFEVTRGQRRLIQLAVGIAALAPWIVWHVLRPPVFDVTVGKQHVEYEFANEHYAELFRAANIPAIRFR